MTPDPPVRRQVVTDARAMRALAHPLRVALLDAMRREGEITATEAAELLGESPGNMSWHLQTLAKYGFVEEAGAGRGRRRPWRLTSDSFSFHTGIEESGEPGAAGEALERTYADRTYAELREWWSRSATYPREWRHAAFVTDSVRYLTAEELSGMLDEIQAIHDRYARRDNAQQRPAGALPVRLHTHGHPLPPTASGN
jgi:DNA-binding transcriptional ArsR family regulator